MSSEAALADYASSGAALAAYEEQLQRSYPAYGAALLVIQDENSQKIPLKLSITQKLMHRVCAEIKQQGRKIRIVIVKARRVRMSTYFNGRFFHRVANNPNTHAMIVSHEPKSSDYLFGMDRRFQDNLPEDFKPEEKFNNKKMIHYAVLDSTIQVATAGKQDVGSSQMFHLLLLSEVSKWPAHTATEIFDSLLPCVPPHNPDTEIVLESTAKGLGGEFHERALLCRYICEFYLVGDTVRYKFTVNHEAPEENEFTRVFIPWFVMPEYQTPAPANFLRTVKEQRLAKLYGLNNARLYWRRCTIANLFKGKTEKFLQEFPSNFDEAFLGSGSAVFPAMTMQELKKAAPDPIARYECEISTGQWIQDDEGRLLVWREPVAGRRYVLPADVAEGLEKGDFDSASVLDQLTGEQMATWHGKIDTRNYAKILAYLAYRYNTAWIIPERNNHGHDVCNSLVAMKYPRIYVETRHTPPQQPVKRYGWLTGSSKAGGKYAIIDNLVALVKESPHLIKDAGFFHEALTFIKKEGGELEAQEGNYFDDKIMDMAIGQFARLRLPLPSMEQTPVSVGGVNAAKSKRPPVRAWTT